MELEKLLLKVYSSAAVTLFLKQYRQGILKNTAARKLFACTHLIDPPEGRLLKRNRVDILCETFAYSGLVKVFYEQQSVLCKAALEIVVWYGRIDLATLEQQIGGLISRKATGRMAYACPYELQGGFELFRLNPRRRTYGVKATKEETVVFLPGALRRILRDTISPPPGYDLIPLPEREKTQFSHCSEVTVLTEIVQMAEYIDQGYLARKKNGQPSVRGLRDLARLTGLREFYPEGFGKAMARLRVERMSDFLVSFKQLKTAGNLSAQLFLRRLLKAWFSYDYSLMDAFLNHLRLQNSWYYQETYTLEVKKTLQLILENMETNAWYSPDAVMRFCLLRDLRLLEFNDELLFRFTEKTSYGSWKSWGAVDEFSLEPLVFLPLLKAFFFFMAACGVVEIEYNEPVNDLFQDINCDYLTPFDGLRYIRLTRLGAYVIGRDKSYKASAATREKVTYTLDNTRLLLTMEGEDPIASLTLEKMLDPVGAGRYRMSFASLFRDCLHKKDVQARIAMFRKSICRKPPPVWQDFFKKAVARVDPLSTDSAFKVFKVEQNEELLRILSSAPEIRPLVLKVEGLRIAVKTEDLTKLTGRLKKYGFLLSQKSLSR